MLLMSLIRGVSSRKPCASLLSARLTRHSASGDLAPWSDIPTALLRAELGRRQDEVAKPACGSRGARGAYDTSLHVGALILILVLSTAGTYRPSEHVAVGADGIAACSFPIVVRRFPRLPVPHHLLFLSRHFGTGVLIATAFVHLLPTAFVSLTDPCLPSFWNHGYPAMAGLIAMTSVLIVVGIEMFFATRGAGHMHGSEYDTLPAEGAQKDRMNGYARPSHHRSDSWRPFREADIGLSGQHHGVHLGQLNSSQEHLVSGRSPSIPKDSPHVSNGNPFHDDDNSENNSDLDLDELDPTADTSNHPHLSLTNPQPPPPSSLSDHQLQQKALLQCLLLEAGILFHSIFIGMALSVSVGPPFIILLIAISFHQTFEGLALGSRIAAITSFPPSSPKPWLMALAYGTTTPVGQAIGIAVQGLYDPQGEMGLVMVGVMNAISSGLLLFAGLVELLAEDFLSDRSYEVLKGRRRLEACGAVVAGSLLMALVGAWA